MSKENAEYNLTEMTQDSLIESTEESFDFEELETKLQKELEEQFADLDMLKEERDKIGSEEDLVNNVMDVVWEQFTNQIAVHAGEDFIKENNDLRLDLRKDAHIQTTKNFEEGNIATHNTNIDYQKRYDDYQARFQRDEHGEILRNRVNQQVLEESARKEFDRGRHKGSKTVHIDHTISAGEINRDVEANTHLSREEQIDFANSDKNLNPLDAIANQSKGDKKMTDWLEHERDNQKPAERFDIDEKQLREKDRIARDKYEKTKQEGIQKSIETGKQSRKKEAFRMTGSALRVAVMQLFTDFMREMMSKLIKWFKSAKKNAQTLIDHLKEAISSFVNNLKRHFKNAGNAVLTTIFTSIYGPIVATIKKVWILLKQGWKSIKDAIQYLKNPENSDQPLGIRMLEIGKIVMAGISSVSAIALGEVIEKSLITIPILAIEIPLLGSLASLIGLFMGGLTAGIIGAIAINLIDRISKQKQLEHNQANRIDKGNEVLHTQTELLTVTSENLVHTKDTAFESINERRERAKTEMEKSLHFIFETDEKEDKDKKISFTDLQHALDKLEE